MPDAAIATRTKDTTGGDRSLSEFFLDHGRLPFVDDEIKPWRYRGWLLPYRAMAEAHPQVAPRYDYAARTLRSGKLLDEPIPRIDFIGEFDPAARPGLKQIEKMVEIVSYRSSSWNAFRDICEWLGYALGVTSEPSKLSADLQDQMYRFFNLEPWLLHPTDYLGQHLCELSHNKRGGFFPTPMNVCRMMAEMTMDRSADLRSQPVMDPCVGTGRFLLVGSNYSMRLFGQDIDPLVVLVTKINLALYAPWHHIPESFHADADAKKPIGELSEGWKPPPASSIAKMGAIQPTPAKKVYTTDIEQPTLFEF